MSKQFPKGLVLVLVLGRQATSRGKMAGVSKLSPTDRLSGEVPNLPSTPLWCHLYLGPVSRSLCRSRPPGHQACERALELLQARRCTLLVLAIEVGGSWSQEAFLRRPTVVGPSKSPNHPSPAQSLFHQCFDPPVVSPNHSCSQLTGT